MIVLSANNINGMFVNIIDLGSLSSRMSGENNAWMETWSEAMPIPVVLQKRLFNETKEAETVHCLFTIFSLIIFFICLNQLNALFAH